MSVPDGANSLYVVLTLGLILAVVIWDTWRTKHR